MSITEPPGLSRPADLSGLFASQDVRGVVPDPLSAQVAEALGAAFATVVVIPESGDDATPASPEAPATGTLTCPVVVLGRDMRASGPDLSAAFARGLMAAGVDVVDIGLCSADTLSYASGTLEAPAAMVTANDDPAEYNGLTLCRAGARPVRVGTGLDQVRELAEQYLTHGLPGQATQLGQITHRDLLADYAAFLRSLVDVSGIRRLKVVVDAGNGMAGLTAPAVLGTAAGLAELPIDLVPLYFELDAAVARHEAYPAEPENLTDLQAAVVAHGADVGLAFDGDGDRCIVLDENGAVVSPSAIIALVGLREVVRDQRDGRRPTVVHNLVTSAAVPDLMTAAGADVVRTRVGHSSITTQMAARDAVFGGEHDAHYYFRDFFFADSGMLAALHVLAALGEQPHPLSALAEVYEPYSSSGEISSPIADAADARARVVDAYVTRQGAGPVTVDELDGLTVSHWEDHPQWWFNLRAAGAEPVLRLNVEAADEDIMIKVRDDVLALVRDVASPTASTSSTTSSSAEGETHS
ncbi:phosphomannomutase [Sanguibacter gelidistatuariae]|uniref:Phosphomannomutase n=1 Tax=Sanguibacter gelidistatuariae TaxID=1814289 RepID=A0A1G6VXT3_9MICO|nr:phosphomannomutase/phosphoglucomutase [Sanguibacter gelidistatuariae]SDD57777.1 phosphomannomutase [Sanguibacter gelidistatuariae]